MEKSTHIQTIMEVQKQVAEAGLTNIVDQEKIYNSANVLSESLGFRDTSQFFDDPTKKPPPEPEESPEERAIEAQQQIEIMKLEIDRQKLEIERFNAQVDARKVELDHEAKIYEIRAKGYGQAQMDSPEMEPIPPLPPPPPIAPTPVPPGFEQQMAGPGLDPMADAFAARRGGLA
jgi:hypothetical protein